jgi:hypothetical protein
LNGPTDRSARFKGGPSGESGRELRCSRPNGEGTARPTPFRSGGVARMTQICQIVRPKAWPRLESNQRPSPASNGLSYGAAVVGGPRRLLGGYELFGKTTRRAPRIGSGMSRNRTAGASRSARFSWTRNVGTSRRQANAIPLGIRGTCPRSRTARSAAQGRTRDPRPACRAHSKGATSHG